MQYRFRPWQLAAALTAVCLLAIGGALWWRHRHQPSPAELLSALPSDAGAVLFLDVGALRDAGIIDRILGPRVNEEPEYKQFVEQSGFDYKADVDRIVGRLTEQTKYFIITGRFNWKQLIAYAEQNGGKCWNGYCTMQGSSPQRIISFYPIRQHAMALAISPDEYAARRISNRSTVTAGVTIPDQPIWLEVPGAALASAESLPAGTRVFARALSGADRVVFGLGPDGERFSLSMDVTCQSAQEAAVLKAQIEGLTETLKKMIAQENLKPNPHDLSGVLTQGSFVREDRTVKARWPLERGFLEALGG